ncbi:MAG: hypothetical protein IPL00_19270, partial [Gammaproteobacteria bacterium]|nr:hypothetical protein [Gammaproteobacteria bacterium]
MPSFRAASVPGTSGAAITAAGVALTVHQNADFHFHVVSPADWDYARCIAMEVIEPGVQVLAVLDVIVGRCRQHQAVAHPALGV